MKKLLICTFLYLACIFLYAEDHGISYSINYEYNLKEDKNQVYLELTEVESYKYLTKESLKIRSFTFDESYNTELKSVSYTYDFLPITNLNTYSTYQNGDSFSSNIKKHYVEMNREPRINAVFEIKKRYKIRDLSFEPMVFIPNYDNLQKVNISLKLDKKYRVEPKFFFFGDSLKYTVDTTKKGISVCFDSLKFSEILPYTDYKGLNAYVYFQIYQMDQLINYANTEEYFKHYLQSFSSYNEKFPDFLRMCKYYDKADTTHDYTKYVDYSDSYDQTLAKVSKLQNNTLTNIKSMITELERSETELDKLAKIYSFVRANIRYIAIQDSIHNIVPHEPISVISNGYGDCKDLAYLIHSIAKAYSIETNMALVNSKYRMDKDNVNPSLFNHVITVYRKSGKSYYLDATCPYYFFGEMPESFYGLNYLLLEENNVKMYDFPQKTEKPSLQAYFITDLDSLQNSECTLKLRDDYRIITQYNEKQSNDTDFENNLNKLLSDNIPYVKFTEVRVESRSDSLYTIKAKADLRTFFISSKNRFYLRKFPFNQYYTEMDKRNKDNFKFYMADHNDIVLDIALKNKVNFQGEALNLEYKGNRHTLSFDKNQKIQIRYRNEMLRQSYPAAAKSEIQDFIRKLYQKKNDMIIITKEL
jgi:hypothetical protein